jgi:transcriptional regulator GlxA family with amidase domain
MLACLAPPPARIPPPQDAVLDALIGRFAPARPSPGLAPWQERRAKQVFAQRIASGVALAEVARECRLSRGHFCKAFKRSTGESPHAWFTRHRVEAAQALLRDTREPLAAIALACGFGDQSHLTRVFGRLVGTSPGLWRQAVGR